MNATQSDAAHPAEHDAHAEGHASAAFYVWIGVILAVVTGVEVAIFYIEALDDIEAPLLVILSAAKVVLVVMYFMHLKMEPRFITGVFMAGLVLATFMVTALIILYHVLAPVGALGPFVLPGGG
jgi:heme/copper-type cytochrome/quinol oxidase subunit 4